MTAATVPRLRDPRQVTTPQRAILTECAVCARDGLWDWSRAVVVHMGGARPCLLPDPNAGTSR